MTRPPSPPGPRPPTNRGPRSATTRWGAALVGLAAAALVVACSDGESTEPRPPVTVAAPPTLDAYRVEVVAEHPHDPEAFTQGLLVDARGRLVEGTGIEGESQLRVVDLETGSVEESVDLPDDVFGEGVTEVVDADGGSRFVQLTWQDETAFVWDAATLEPRGTFSYEGEGWGLCTDDSTGSTRLVRSDGSPTLTFHDPETFAVLGTQEVTLTSEAGAQPVEEINELECVDGDVWANIWRTDTIVQIDLATGEVEGVVDASSLLPLEERVGIDVLNGIAKVPGTDTWYLTGKRWPTLFEVRFVPTDPTPTASTGAETSTLPPLPADG